MAKTYWNHNGKHQLLAEALGELIPHTGSVAEPRKNKALEKFRKAQNCYYDLYNNGLCNRAAEFRHVFGIATTPYRFGRGRFSSALYVEVEARIDAIIEEAAKEQGLDATKLQAKADRAAYERVLAAC